MEMFVTLDFVLPDFLFADQVNFIEAYVKTDLRVRASTTKTFGLLYKQMEISGPAHAIKEFRRKYESHFSAK